MTKYHNVTNSQFSGQDIKHDFTMDANKKNWKMTKSEINIQ